MLDVPSSNYMLSFCKAEHACVQLFAKGVLRYLQFYYFLQHTVQYRSDKPLGFASLDVDLAPISFLLRRAGRPFF